MSDFRRDHVRVGELGLHVVESGPPDADPIIIEQTVARHVQPLARCGDPAEFITALSSGAHDGGHGRAPAALARRSAATWPASCRWRIVPSLRTSAV
jgi:hypothetical protein